MEENKEIGICSKCFRRFKKYLKRERLCRDCKGPKNHMGEWPEKSQGEDKLVEDNYDEESKP